jgi:hypothetical protein
MGVLENKLIAEIDSLPASKNFFVEFSRRNDVVTSESRISQAKAGKDYDGPMISALLGQIERLKKFRDAMRPLPIRFEDPELVTTLVKDFECGSLAVKIQQFGTLDVIYPFWVITIGSQLFERVGDDRVMKTADYQKCAAFKTPDVANIVARLLSRMDQNGIRVIPIQNVRRDPSTIYQNVADCGFTSEQAA